MISLILIIMVALEHLHFGYIEMFGAISLQAKAFGFEEAELKNKLLQVALSNQGIYNVGVGLLIIALTIINASIPVLSLTMIFVVLVGIYGAVTVTKKIFLIQALPALISLILLFLLV